ncbi:MAG: hypothetical protein E7Z93_00960 [Cyanobacteria bacterium SIG32]|nr:hypothetical protein [Cyanobacteria bacterium SIG32]
MKITTIDKLSSNVTFQGFKPTKNDKGNKVYEFNFPFDNSVYDCYLEVYEVGQDDKGNYFITDLVNNTDTEDGQLKLQPGSNKVDLSYSYLISDDKPFAYHYKLVNRNNSNERYFRVDAGDVIDKTSGGNDYEIYNVVSSNGSRVARGGSMKLIIPDNFNVGWEYNKKLFEDDYIVKNDSVLKRAMQSNKTFSNKIGGTLAGVEKAIDNGEFDGYSSIISLPIFTDDSLSAHAYWNKNCMQMCQSLGNINNYASLQKKMFAKGLNFVSDGAFVNEGLEGIHFANVLKWGEKSPYFNWFKASGLKNGPFLLGVFSKNQDFISHKIVNSPYKYEQGADGIVKISKNRDYDSQKPTYVQIFDDRLVTEEQKKDTKNIIRSYDILNTNNPYDINTHDDTIINYHFEIDPETYNRNVKNLNEYNRSTGKNIRLDEIEGTRFVNKFETFELEEKVESNFETWDANTDIAKLNYVYSHADTEAMKNLTAAQKSERMEEIRVNNNQVRDYAITAGVYWTQKTKDILTLHVAQNLKDIDKSNPKKVVESINKAIADGKFPKKLSVDINYNIISNVLNGEYASERKFRDIPFSEQIKMGIMNYPLDAIELGDNVAGVLASPYITKRASTEDQIAVPRYDLYKQGNPHLLDEHKNAYLKTQSMYENEMMSFANDIVARVQRELPHELSSGSEATLYGKYVLPLMTQEIAKFAVIKALQPNATVYVNKENGEIGYDYDALKQVSLQSLGINGASPEDEALSLVNKIRKGINNIDNKDKKLLADAIAKSLKGTSAESFALADMIVDRTQSGLDWRIDATKDIADMDALRDGKNDFGYAWDQVSNFWKKFNQSVLEVNPNAYLVAEVTDEGDLYRAHSGYQSRYEETGINRKFLNETGMTTVANYSYLFNGTIRMFGTKFEKDHPNEMIYDYSKLPTLVYEKMIGGENYLRTTNLQSLLYSYTFIGNHDKPRALHCYAMDMNQFFADLTDPSNSKARERAYKILNDKVLSDVSQEEVNSFDYSGVSSKAMAMADVMIAGFGKALEELSNTDNDFKKDKSKIYQAVARSIRDLASGSYMDQNFNADAFGVKPFDIVIDTIVKQAKAKHDLPLSKKDMEKFQNKTFKIILEPAYSKLIDSMKMLVALPGKPTLFSGDDLGATGYEEKTKNIYLQDRNYLHNEWLNDPNKKFIKEKYDELKSIMALRSRPDLDALNNGAPFTLQMQNVSNGDHKTQVSGLLRQNTDGRMTISLFNMEGISHDPQYKNGVKPMYFNDNKIVLDEIAPDGKSNNHIKIGLRGGLKEGDKFINANNPEDVYYVHKYGNSYCLEHHDKSAICISERAMILYHVPEKSQIWHTGKIEYKVPTNQVANAYANA